MGTTIVLTLLLAAAVAAIVRKLVLDRRQGKSSCGCGCKSCPSAKICHPGKPKASG